ncbi:unnamed protein product [Rhizophagus irregularis]|nr:unnamed protein product [Rhizophagus irregularis]
MYYALALIYCPWQIIHILQLVNDLYPNVAWAEIFQILPRTLIASFSVLYPLSILYSTEQFLQNRDNLTSPVIWKIIPACLFLLVLFIYVTLRRSNIIFINGINLTIIIIWNYGLPIFIHVIQWVMIYNTHVASKKTSEEIHRNNLYNSTYSYYNVDIKSKKAELMKNGVSTIPNNNNDNNYNQRFSILSLPDNNNNNNNTKLLHHSYNGSSSNNVKLIKKSHRNTTTIVNNY